MQGRVWRKEPIKDGAWTNSWDKLIACIDEEFNDAQTHIDAVDSNYEKITITVDSGAADTVGPKHIAQAPKQHPDNSKSLQDVSIALRESF